MKIGEILNQRYKVIKQIGEGGMAHVYLAKDLYLERLVAIKNLKKFSDPKNNARNLERFNREINSLSRLVCRNVVKIYDVVNTSNENNVDDIYIVMEYVSSTNLKDVIKKRAPLYYIEALRIFREMANAIKEAHHKGIIHRDIKPHNVLISDDGLVKIVDFGIALINNGVEITTTNSIVGSIQYMAPEILKGQQPSFQSDIYAFGIILYEILVGKPPFEDKTINAIAKKHINDSIPSVTNYNLDIPDGIDIIIRKCTAKNLNSRYKSVDKMLQDIDFVLNDINNYADKTQIKIKKPIQPKNQSLQINNVWWMSNLFVIFMSSITGLIFILSIAAFLDIFLHFI